MPEIDLIIVGAGPSGLSTALHLVREDPAWADRLIVLEGKSHPRHKLCGGGVTRLGLDFLAGLGLPDPLPIPHARVEDARFQYAGRVVHVRGNPEFVVFHRMAFDNLLAQTARSRGIRICEEEPVRSIELLEDGVAVRTSRGEYLAQAVVGADGSRGMTRRVLDRARSPIRVARLMEVVHPAAEDAPQFSGRYAIFDFNAVGEGLQGYTWDFPARVLGAASHNRGIFDARVAQNRAKAGLRPILDGALAEMGGTPEKITVEGHPIHWFSPGSPISTRRLLLVGDAAGAEPLFGEGIAPALGYGKYAAQEISRAFGRNDFHFRSYKRRVLFSRLGFYLLLRWWTAWWSYRLSGRPWFMHIMWTIGSGLAGIKNMLNLLQRNK